MAQSSAANYALAARGVKELRSDLTQALETNGRSLILSEEAGTISRRALIGGLTVIILLYLACVNGKWWPTPDSSMYLTLGRSLAEGQGYLFNGSVCTNVTPGLPAILAGLQWAFGPGFWAPQVFAAVCGLATVVMVYAFFRRRPGDAAAAAIAAVTALCAGFFRGARMVLTDVPFAMLFWATLLAAWRFRRGSAGWLLVAAALAVVGVVVRAPGVLLLLPFALGFLLDSSDGVSWRRRLVGATVLAAAAGGTAGAFYFTARQMLDGGTPFYETVATLHSHEGVWGLLAAVGAGLWEFVGAMSEIFTTQDGFWPAGILLTWLVVSGSVRCWKDGRRWAPTVLVLYVVVMAGMQGGMGVTIRYMLPLVPLVVYLWLEGLYGCLEWAARRRQKPLTPETKRKAIAVFALVAVVANAPMALRDAYHAAVVGRTDWYYQTIRGGVFAELFEVVSLLKRQCPTGDLIAADSNKSSILHYLAQRPTINMPHIRGDSVADAEKIRQFVASHDEIDWLVVYVLAENPVKTRRRPGRQEYVAAMTAAFGQSAGWQVVHQGAHYLVCRRADASGPQASPSAATRAPAPAAAP